MFVRHCDMLRESINFYMIELDAIPRLSHSLVSSSIDRRRRKKFRMNQFNVFQEFPSKFSCSKWEKKEKLSEVLPMQPFENFLFNGNFFVKNFLKD